jgi:hypothetical protein
MEHVPLLSVSHLPVVSTNARSSKIHMHNMNRNTLDRLQVLIVLLHASHILKVPVGSKDFADVVCLQKLRSEPHTSASLRLPE